MKQILKQFLFPLWGLRGFYAAAVLLMSVSCKKEDPGPDCGCNSPVIREIRDVPVQFLGDFVFFVNRDPNYVSYFASACDRTLLKGLAASPPDTGNYQISGLLKAPCLPDGIQPIIESFHIELTAIRSNP